MNNIEKNSSKYTEILQVESEFHVQLSTRWKPGNCLVNRVCNWVNKSKKKRIIHKWLLNITRYIFAMRDGFLCSMKRKRNSILNGVVEDHIMFITRMWIIDLYHLFTWQFDLDIELLKLFLAHSTIRSFPQFSLLIFCSLSSFSLIFAKSFLFLTLLWRLCWASLSPRVLFSASKRNILSFISFSSADIANRSSPGVRLTSNCEKKRKKIE